MVDNILRPLLLSGRTAVSGLVIFLRPVAAWPRFRFVGLVIGPIIPDDDNSLPRFSGVSTWRTYGRRSLDPKLPAEWADTTPRCTWTRDRRKVALCAVAAAQSLAGVWRCE